MTSFSLRQAAFMPSSFSRVAAISLRSVSRRSLEASSSSFMSACSSICIWVSWRSTASMSEGMESSSMRRRLAASSTRSMALSGRKRSVM